MADYFDEYPTFAKGLPSPADTPYETPDFIRSKRTSRVLASREASASPPLLPDSNETREKSRDGRYSGVDPRRFTPTLHASLVSEILNLRRELDSKNNLVENLETSLSNAKSENERLEGDLAESNKDVRKAKQQAQQMEKGVYDAVEDLVTERDTVTAALEDLRAKFETVQRRARQQDEDALRTQNIWESEKESWDNERRQLERRVHITETRLRVVVDEVAANQARGRLVEEHSDETTFKDSGLGDGSDTASIRSLSPTKHKRNMSSISSRPRNIHSSMSSRLTAATPDLYAQPGANLADELGIDGEDESDMDDFEHRDEVFEDVQSHKNQITDSHLNSMTTEPNTSPDGIATPTMLEFHESVEAVVQDNSMLEYDDRATTPSPSALSPKAKSPVIYVDTGYQPSPPPSPRETNAAELSQSTQSMTDSDDTLQVTSEPSSERQDIYLKRESVGTLMSPPQTPVIDDANWSKESATPTVTQNYSTVATQTDLVSPDERKGHGLNRDSLSPPSFVPAIAIHPPTSRPSSPRPYVLPPGTKNASSQANLGWPCKNASVQTDEIRIDRRPMKLPPHLLPNNLLPSPAFQEPSRAKRSVAGPPANILTKMAPTSKSAAKTATPVSPPLQSPVDSSPEMSRNNSSKDLRNYPLKAIPLPRPVLSPVSAPVEKIRSNGPLNRSSQYGVTQNREDSLPLGDVDQASEASDHEDVESEIQVAEMVELAPALIRPPPGRFGLSEPPKAVPEDKEISPERRPGTADSWFAAPANSVSGIRASSQVQHPRHGTNKLGQPESRRDFRSRSPSFGSYASSSRSAPSSQFPIPPYPIPLRSSSRMPSKTYSEGSDSPTQRNVFGARKDRSSKSQVDRQASLRKVQSATAIRNRAGRGSPSKQRRRRRSPNLTPVQSMAFESPAPTDFPIPDLPTPLQGNVTHDDVQGSTGLTSSPDGASTQHRDSEETNLVDAIAATMVGEWMWKYIRKRKSFGIGEDNSDISVAGQNGVITNMTAHGTRHKRWVWLSPYERTIMWDNKQPTSGSALMGKKGRKLGIQSVIEVVDTSPLPKSPELPSAWKRSILILTAERALKFTAINEERHQLWLTALSFLAQSGQLPGQVPQKLQPPPEPEAAPVPPVSAVSSKSIDGVPIKRHRSPSFGKIQARDSIRLAHGKRPDLQKSRSQPKQPHAVDPSVVHEEIADSAEFPAVPRLYVSTSKHLRKRSNTSPRIPPTLNNLRSLSSGSPSSSSGNQNALSTNASTSRAGASSKTSSRRDSLTSPDRLNFFEAVGTVRMEAFVDPNVRDGVLYVPAPPPPGVGSSRRPRNGSNLSQSTVDKRRAGYVFDEFGLDPFKGF